MIIQSDSFYSHPRSQHHGQDPRPVPEVGCVQKPGPEQRQAYSCPQVEGSRFLSLHWVALLPLLSVTEGSGRPQGDESTGAHLHLPTRELGGMTWISVEHAGQGPSHGL